MGKGAERIRLDDAVDTAQAGDILAAEIQWRDAAWRIKEVSKFLRLAAAAGRRIEGNAGQELFNVMQISGDRLHDRGVDMGNGERALNDTRTAIVAAREGRNQIEVDLPPYDKAGFTAPSNYDDMPPWRQTEVRQQHDQQQAGMADQREAEREAAARKVADQFEKDYQGPIKIMQDIYGYEPPPPPPTGDAPTPVYGPAGGSGTQSGVYHGPRDGGGGDGDGGGGDGDGGDGGDDPRPPDPVDPPTPVDPPDPVDNGDPDTSTPPPTSPWVDIPGGYGEAGGAAGGGGGGTSVSPAVLGAGAGVVTAGALGAAARSGLASAGVSSLRNLTSRGGPLGGTARGAGPVLGGKGGVGSAGSPTSARGAGAAGRGAGGLRSGAGAGAGGGRGGRGGAGAGGGRGGLRSGAGAGGRGGAGAGAGRGRGKREEEQQQGDRDLFDDGQDWIDDEGAAPGVIG